MVPAGRASRLIRPLLPLVAVLSVQLAAEPARQATHPAPASVAEREAFLLNAKIVRTRSAGKGVTNTLRATLSNGLFTHEASIQTVDEAKSVFEGTGGTEINFKDHWRFNVAAYRLDRLLELGMVPATVARSYRGKPGSFTWWVDDVLMDEQEHYRKKVPTPDVRDWNQQMWITRLFDQLIANVDRNLGNLLIDTSWNVWMIDHSRAFRLNPEPRHAANLSRVERRLLERLRALSPERVAETVGEHLTDAEIEALLKRRDFIVAHFDRGGPTLIFDRKPRCC